MLTSPKITSPGAAEMNGSEPALDGVFEPPESSTLAAIGRRKWLVAALAGLCALAGAIYGLSRPAVYTASATLQVGQVNPNSPGFLGYSESAASLASTFARAIEAEPVLQSVQGRLGLSPSQAVARLSASPIPVSPAFRVIATGPSDAAAVRLANVAAAAVIAYEGQSNSTNPEAVSLLREYQEASLALRRATATVAALAHRRGANAPLMAAEAERNAASEKVQALGVAYTNAIASRAPSSGLVTLVAGAATASSNHSAKVEMFALLGLLAGLVVGCVAAVAVERRRSGRSATVLATPAAPLAEQA